MSQLWFSPYIVAILAFVSFVITWAILPWGLWGLLPATVVGLLVAATLIVRAWFERRETEK